MTSVSLVPQKVQEPERAVFRVQRRKLLFACGSLGLGVAGLGATGYMTTLHYYRHLNETRLDPAGLYFHPFEAAPARGARRRVVALGASSVARWPFPDVHGYQFVKRGIGGQTSSQVLQRFESHVTFLEPDLVLLLCGTNDLKTLPLFPDRKQQIVAQYKRNLGALVAGVRGLGLPLIVVTVFPTGAVPWLRKLVWSQEVNRAIVDVNRHIQGLAADDLRVLDAHRLLVAKGSWSLDKRYAHDELHLNEAGYSVLNTRLQAMLVG